MANLYVITGPAGVGKSTVSKRIAETKVKSALIEGDDIYNQVVGGYEKAWKEGNHLELFWKICTDMINSYLEEDYDVVFNYIVTPNNIKLLKEKFKNYNIKFAVLLTDEATLLERDSRRPEDCQMKDRCITLLNSFKERDYDKDCIIDTTGLTVDEVVKKVEEK